MGNNKLQRRDFEKIVTLIIQAQNRAYQAVNKELVNLYWQVGKFVSEKVKAGKWGEGIVKQLSDYILSKFPNLKGFNKRGLYRMKQFYETYKDIEKVSPLLTQLTWSNHLAILTKCKTIEEKQFYILLAIKEKLSFRDLIRQIESGVFERTILSKPFVSTALTQLPKTSTKFFKDTYKTKILLRDEHLY